MRVVIAGLRIAAVLAVGGCGGGTMTITTSGGATGTSGASVTTTSPDELARIEATANQWNVVLDSQSQGTKLCEDRARSGIESYESCRARQIQALDEAGVKLAKTYATLSRVVDPDCGKALESIAQHIRETTFATPDHAVSACKRTVSG